LESINSDLPFSSPMPVRRKKNWGNERCDDRSKQGQATKIERYGRVESYHSRVGGNPG
jgi:hypothetical protein